MPTKDMVPIALAGLLHDIGNMKVDQAILTNTSRLTSDELKNVTGLNEGTKLAALQHHERENGSGYPLGVSGNKIHIYAKIISVTDIFHAMTTRRSHKGATSPYVVLEELMKESFGKLDPVFVQVFINKLTQFNQGTVVRLNDDSDVGIIYSDRTNPTRPLVRVKGRIINPTLQRSL